MRQKETGDTIERLQRGCATMQAASEIEDRGRRASSSTAADAGVIQKIIKNN